MVTQQCCCGNDMEQAPSPSVARLAGALYLGTIIFGLFAEVGARGSLIVGSDPAATTRAILASEPLFRAGIAADLVMLACYLGVTTLFLDMFRPVHAGMSRMAAAFSLIGIAALAADTLLLLAPLRLLATTPYLAQLEASQREAADVIRRERKDVRHPLLSEQLSMPATRPNFSTTNRLRTRLTFVAPMPLVKGWKL